MTFTRVGVQCRCLMPIRCTKSANSSSRSRSRSRAIWPACARIISCSATCIWRAEPELTKRLLEIGLTGIAFESVEDDNGWLPLLAPMSIIAGRIAIQIGTHLLHQPAGGKGKLLGGLPSTERGKVVVLGAGAAGGNSAALAAAGGANVSCSTSARIALPQMMALGANVTALYPYEEYVAPRSARRRSRDRGRADSERQGTARGHAAMVKSMEPGSVLADISIDQGGCFETSRANHVGRADLCGRRGDAFLRDQHARRRAADFVAGDFVRRSCRTCSGLHPASNWREYAAAASVASISRTARSCIRHSSERCCTYRHPDQEFRAQPIPRIICYSEKSYRMYFR